MHSPHFAAFLDEIEIATPDAALAPALQQKIDNKTKPRGALGRLETLALRIGLIQQTLSPHLEKPHLIIFAGDHGAAKAGISAFPQEVTWQMVQNFLAGGAAVNVFADQSGMALYVVDAGVAHDFGPRERLIDEKIAHGTANYIEAPAMTPAQCLQALQRGAALMRKRTAAGCNVVGFGEMGIGNTAAASLITHCLTGEPLSDCVGRGTGLDDEGLALKRQLLTQALARHRAFDGGTSPLEVLTAFGGFEIAMMTGAMLAAAQARAVVIVDGFIVGAAALVAARLFPAFTHYCVFSHRSAEPGHVLQLKALGGEALLDLGLRLGEGTGAALAFPLVRAAVNFLNQMASFEAAGVAEER